MLFLALLSLAACTSTAAHLQPWNELRTREALYSQDFRSISARHLLDPPVSLTVRDADNQLRRGTLGRYADLLRRSPEYQHLSRRVAPTPEEVKTKIKALKGEMKKLSGTTTGLGILRGPSNTYPKELAKMVVMAAVGVKGEKLAEINQRHEKAKQQAKELAAEGRQKEASDLSQAYSQYVQVYKDSYHMMTEAAKHKEFEEEGTSGRKSPSGSSSSSGSGGSSPKKQATKDSGKDSPKREQSTSGQDRGQETSRRKGGALKKGFFGRRPPSRR